MPYQEGSFSFLGAGPRFGIMLPEDFNLVPRLASPFFVEDAARSFDFIPSHRDNGMPDDIFLGTRSGRDDRTVEIYKRATYTQWWLRWPLTAGALYTFLTDEDGLEKSDLVLRSISITEDAVGAPFVLADPPVKPALTGWPGFQEHVNFSSSVRDWSLTIRRPSLLAEGKIMKLPQDETNGAVYRAGAGYRIEVIVRSAQDWGGGRDFLQVVLNSLSQA